MSTDEDQQNELEAMESIYGPDFQLESSTPPRAFIVTLAPNADGVDNHVTCRLHVTFPSDYPNVSPEIIVRPVKGLNNEQMNTLSSIASSEAAENVGQVCIFQICDALKDWLVTNNAPSLSMFDQMEQRKKAESDKVEAANAVAQAIKDKADASKKQVSSKGPSPLGIEPGTIVTVESFLRWKALFDEEQLRIREEKEAALLARERKLTGKQLFMQNLAKELGDDEAEAMVEEKEDPSKKVFFFNQGLFADEEVDLNDPALADEVDSESDESDESDDEPTEKLEIPSSSISVPAPSSSSPPAAKPQTPAAQQPSTQPTPKPQTQSARPAPQPAKAKPAAAPASKPASAKSPTATAGKAAGGKTAKPKGK